MEEVERVARLIFTAWRDWYKIQPFFDDDRFEPDFDKISQRQKDAYYASARAVIADLCPQPIIVDKKGI